MTITTFDPPAQAGFDASNPYLIILLRQTLGEQNWTMQRLALAMRWDQEFRAKVTELALELDLITPASLMMKAKPKPLPLPETADILILPVLVRPRPEPAKIKPGPERPPERREPAPWNMEVLAGVTEEQPQRQPSPPAPWIVDGENDDG